MATRVEIVTTLSGHAQVHTGLQSINNDLVQLGAQGQRSGAQMAAAFTQPIAPLQRLTTALNTLRFISLGLGTTALTRELVQQADAYTLMNARVRLVTSSQAEFNKVQKNLFDIAQLTRSSLQATTDLFARVARNTGELRFSTNEILTFVEQVQKLVIVSGANITEAQFAIIQLAQGLALGTLRGDELRSVMEQLPAVAKAIADGIGITRKEFLELALSGKITADAIISGVLEMQSKTDEAFRQMPITAGQAFQQMLNSFTVAIGRLNENLGATSELGAIFRAIGDNAQAILEPIRLIAENLDVITAAAVVYVARGLGPMIQAQIMAAAAQAQLTAAVVSGNFVLTQGANAQLFRARAVNEATRADYTAQVATVQRLNNEKALVAQQLLAARSDAARAQQNLVLAQAELAAARAMVERAGVAASIVGANVRVVASEAAVREALVLRNTMMAEAARLNQLHAATSLELSAANNILAATSGRVAAAQAGVATAFSATSIAARAATVAMGFLRGAMAFLGGPVGATITVVAGALYLLSQRTTDAGEAQEKYNRALETTRRLLTDLNAASGTRVMQTRIELENILALAQAEVTAAQGRLEAARARNRVLQEGGVEVLAAGDLFSRAEAEALEAAKNNLNQLNAEITDFLQKRRMLGTDEGGGGFSGFGDGEGAKAFERVVAALTLQIQNLQRTRREQALYNALAQAQITIDDARAQVIANLVNHIADFEERQEALNRALEEEHKLMEEGRQVTLAMRTALEQYMDELTRLKELREAEAISEVTLARARQDAHDRMMDRLRDEADVSKGLAAPFVAYRESLQNLMDAYRLGAVSQFAFIHGLTQIREALAQNLLATGEWVATMEGVAIVVEDAMGEVARSTVSALLTGRDAWEAFKEVLVRVIDEIIESLVSLAINAITAQQAVASVGSGGGSGFLGALFGLVGSAFGGTSAVTASNTVGIGGAQSLGGFFHFGGPRATGGTQVFTRPTLLTVAETGPERVSFQPMSQAPTRERDEKVGNTYIIDLRYSNGSDEIEERVNRALRNAVPGIVEASVQTVRSRNQRDPAFLGTSR